MDTPAPDRSLDSRLTPLQGILREILRAGNFELDFTVRKSPGESASPDTPDVTIEFTGRDADLLIEKNGAVLDAIEYVVVKAARLDEESFVKIDFDAKNWRRLRAEELKTMATIAAERVIETGDPFELSPMTPRERRIVHLALRDEPRVRTASEGRGADRRVVIQPASLPARP
jgi:spoIIIJ-associated protein